VRGFFQNPLLKIFHEEVGNNWRERGRPRFYLVTTGSPSSLTIAKCMSSSTATLPKMKAKLRYEFFIIVKSKYISPFITQKVNSVYL
jgi:hypothetical protein